MKIENKNWFKRHWILSIGLGCVLLVFLIGIFLIRDNDIEIQKQNVSEDLKYMNTIKQYLDIIETNNDLEQSIISYIGSGDISLFEAGSLFKQTGENWKMLRQNLNNMEVPNKFVNYHAHMVNSVKYREEASNLMEQGCLKEDTYLLDKATDKIYLGVKELKTASNILKELKSKN
ncbi:MAG: hypothetical protein ACTSXD_11700 [Candidatus Heimdallarchaeaceae archaeon]